MLEGIGINMLAVLFMSGVFIIIAVLAIIEYNVDKIKELDSNNHGHYSRYKNSQK